MKGKDNILHDKCLNIFFLVFLTAARVQLALPNCNTAFLFLTYFTDVSPLSFPLLLLLPNKRSSFSRKKIFFPGPNVFSPP